MKDERNPRLYWGWFALFISLTAIAGMITMILLPVFGHMASEPLSNLSLVSVVLGGIPMMAIYGFVFRYFPGYSYNQILRGKAAAAWNILLIVFYLAMLTMIGVLSWKNANTTSEPIVAIRQPVAGSPNPSV